MRVVANVSCHGSGLVELHRARLGVRTKSDRDDRVQYSRRAQYAWLREGSVDVEVLVEHGAIGVRDREVGLEAPTRLTLPTQHDGLPDDSASTPIKVDLCAALDACALRDDQRQGTPEESSP